MLCFNTKNTVVFTFYSSSIKGNPQVVEVLKPLEFTFYSSSIKGIIGIKVLDHLIDLHSILVLLKETGARGQIGRIGRFTFYSSSIIGFLTSVLVNTL